jgi:hypothetical protein
MLKGLAWLTYVFHLSIDNFLDHLLSALENKTTCHELLASRSNDKKKVQTISATINLCRLLGLIVQNGRG